MRRCYRAQTADAAADRRAQRLKPAKLVSESRLRAVRYPRGSGCPRAAASSATSC